MTHSAMVYLALGSNLGDRRATLESAIEALRRLQGVRVIKVSRMIETDPVGSPNQGKYLNAAVEAEVTLTPSELLAACLEIERAHGRVRSESHRWGARTLDIDILLYDDRVVDAPGLRIPHPRMHERGFVLNPLAEIAPDLVHPELGQTIESLLRQAPTSSTREYERGEPCSFR